MYQLAPRPTLTAEERFALLPPAEQREMATLFCGVVTLIGLKLNQRQSHCDTVAAHLLEDINL